MRSCRLEALLLLAALPLAGLTLASRSDPAPLAGPTIVSTVPANATVQVPLTAMIQVAFSERMNETSVNASIVITPAATLVISWPTDSLLQLQPAPALTNCTPYTVRLDGTNATGAPLAPGPVPNPWSFMTACNKPFILSTTPPDRSTAVRNDTDIVVTFSKPMMNCNSGGITINLVPSLPPPGETLTSCDASNTTWTFHLRPGTRFQTGTNYNVSVAGQDQSGNPLVAGLVRGDPGNPWTFTVNALPTVSRPYLDRTGCLASNTAVLVAWNMSDNETPVSSLVVRLSFLNNASAWETITGPRPGFGASASYRWTLPAVDLLATRVRVEVNDSSGGMSSNESDTFRIDTGPPSVVQTTPKNGDSNVPTDTPIAITFSEPMDEASVQAAISATPSFLAPSYTWSQPDVVTVSTGGLLDNTTYTVTVAATARDTCGPGLTMLADYVFSFTTAKPQPSAVSGLTVTSVGDSSVTLTWNAVTTFLSGATIPPGTRVEYWVYWSKNESVKGQALQTTDLTMTHRGLEPSTTYYYQVFAVVDGVPSPSGAPATARTLTPFLSSPAGGLFLLVLLAGIAAAVLVGDRLRRQQKREEADAALTAEIGDVVDLTRTVRSESNPTARHDAEERLQAHFRSLVAGGEEGEEGPADPRLEGLYRALAKALIQSPEVDVKRGRRIVDARLGKLAETLRRQGAAYRLLSEAEASVESGLFRGLPESARKALVLVYFYGLEEYLSRRLRALIPPGSTLLLGERGHINVRRRGWEARWNALTLGNLLYLMEHNAHFFIADEARWEERVAPWLREVVEARNNTAHPSREAPPLERVRDLVYRAVPLIEAVLRKRPEAPAA